VGNEQKRILPIRNYATTSGIERSIHKSQRRLVNGGITVRKPAIATRVSPVVNNAVRQLTKALGITISEYLRKLILDDLESKQMFRGEFKKTVEQPQTKDLKERIGDSIRKLLSEPEEEKNHETFR